MITPEDLADARGLLHEGLTRMDTDDYYAVIDLLTDLGSAIGRNRTEVIAATVEILLPDSLLKRRKEDPDG